jgi:integrase
MEKIKFYADILYVSDDIWRKKAKEKERNYTDKVWNIKTGIAKNYIIPLWGEYLPNELSHKKINDPLKNIPLSGCMKNRILFCLSCVYCYLIEEDICNANPVNGVIKYSRKQKVKRAAISKEDMKKLFPEDRIELLKIHRTQRYLCAFLVLRDTGMRPGELVALKWSDWHPQEKFLPIMKAIESGTRDRIKCTKTGTVRPALVSQKTADELERLYTMIKPQMDDYIFATIKENVPYDTRRLSWNFHQAVERAGLNHPEWVPYNLRHTFNTRALVQCPDAIVQRLLGHLSEKMTIHYRDADVETLMEEAKTIMPYYDALDHIY